MKPDPTFGDLAVETVRILWARLRYKVAHLILDAAWVAWFFMAKGTAARLYQAARKVVEDHQ